MNSRQDKLDSEHCARKLRALSEPMRLRIIEALHEGPRNVGQLAQLLEAEVVGVSHHLGVLRQSELVEKEKAGRFAVYRLSPEFFQPAPTGDSECRVDFGCCQLVLLPLK